jgi:hypothetical protein
MTTLWPKIAVHFLPNLRIYIRHKEVLQPLLNSLRSISQKDSISRLTELDERLEKNAERQNTLTTLMTRGYLDLELFTQKPNKLLAETQALTEEKEHLVFSANGEIKKIEKLADFIRFSAGAIIFILQSLTAKPFRGWQRNESAAAGALGRIRERPELPPFKAETAFVVGKIAHR